MPHIPFQLYTLLRFIPLHSVLFVLCPSATIKIYKLNIFLGVHQFLGVNSHSLKTLFSFFTSFSSEKKKKDAKTSKIIYFKQLTGRDSANDFRFPDFALHTGRFHFFWFVSLLSYLFGLIYGTEKRPKSFPRWKQFE